MKINFDRLSPVAVYTHTRYSHLVKTLASLKNNFLAPHTVLYVVSDAPKLEEQTDAVRRIREYVDNLTGFREIIRIYHNKNLGAKLSVSNAERTILGDHGVIISMEDDNVSSRNYLDFMNGGLQYFQDDSSVYSISGYRPAFQEVRHDDKSDIWFYPWNISWGYALWKSKYQRINPIINNYPLLRKLGKIQEQNRAGGLYVSDSLKRDYEGKKYFPDAILGTEMFIAGMKTVIPVISKIKNIGQDGSGVSSRMATSKYDGILDISENRIFNYAVESSYAALYREKAKNFYNGGFLTRLSRYAGIYHELSKLRANLSFKNKF